MTKPCESPVEDRYYENQRKFSLEDLAPYFDRHVAWSRDGSKILASGSSHEDVEKQLNENGVDPTQVVFGYVHNPDISYFG